MSVIQRANRLARAPRGAPVFLTSIAVCVSFALGAGSASSAFAQPVKPCHVKLSIRFSPEVPDPRNPGFLSSFEGQPGFRLIWEGGSNSNMSQTLELIGPGPEYRCMREVDRMRKDARVIDLRVVAE